MILRTTTTTYYGAMPRTGLQHVLLMMTMTTMVTILLSNPLVSSFSFSCNHPSRIMRNSKVILSMSDEPTQEWQNNPLGSSSNTWKSINDNYESQQDWQEVMARKKDGSFWSDFEPSDDDDDDTGLSSLTSDLEQDDANDIDYSEQWLNTLAGIAAEEVEFNIVEAERANKAREMAEWGFDSQTIKNTFGIAVDDSMEKDEVEGMQTYRQESYLDDDDWKTVESHTKVEIDEETGEPVRQQMVYVDEHTCIGCTNCAMIAQSTFFMQEEHGRARVFQQWGDDDETIQVAIETCPVDCIHYVPYDELVKLEIERRDQNINFKARLVSQGEYGTSLAHRVGGANGFTAPQKISGNMGARCNNCPSRGCKNCPMFGVGKNPEFERKEKERLERRERRRLQKEREEAKKSVDL